MTYVFDPKTNRRRFLTTTAAGAAAGAAVAGLSGCHQSYGSKEHAIPANPAGQAKWGREAGEWIPSCCNMCGGQSGILVHVVDGVVQKIEPNHWNPNNYSNISTDFFEGYTEEYGCREGGAICPKGNAGIMQLYDPDRVKTPLKRTNPDKTPGVDPRWQEIGWDQALDEIAAKLRALRDGGEAHKLLWISEDHSFTHIQGDLCELYGTPNYSNHSNLCDTSRKASFKAVVGDERPLADFLQSKYILLWGWNPTSAIKWVYLPRIMTRAIERGARLVVIDPYLSDTAAKAHEWVPIRPSTDGALALAMGHVIVRDGLYDKDYVASWTTGFEEYADFVKDKTPAWAEKITSVPAATIERLAREVATTKPACIDAWSGPGQHSNGVQGGRAIAALAALVGGYDRPGTMVLPEKKGNKHAHVHPEAKAKVTLAEKRFDELHLYPFPHKSGVYARMFDNLANDKGPYRPKAMVCVFQNPMMSVPGTSTVAKALAKLEMVVVVDTMLSETAMMADYVLPGTTYLERYDLNTHWVTWPVLALRQPVVKPIFGQLAEYEMVASLGRRIGLRDEHGHPYFEIGPLSGQPIENLTAWYEDVLSNELKNGEPKITLDELRKLPGAVWVSKKGTRYEKFAAPLDPAKLTTAWFSQPAADGAYPEGTQIYDKPKTDGGKRIGTVIRGQAVTGFMTPSGKIELVAKGLDGKQDANGKPVDPRPVYTQRDDYPDAEFPLFLINWKEASHTHTRTQNNPWLLELRPAAPLIIHPETAVRFGVKDGDDVSVESRYGRVTAKVHVSRRIHPEVVGLQHGFGHTELGANARGRGTSDASLRPCVADPLGGQALHKQTAVRIRRA
jgi:thiosulfate reductase/polysulfide reductase chain A